MRALRPLGLAALAALGFATAAACGDNGGSSGASFGGGGQGAGHAMGSSAHGGAGGTFLAVGGGDPGCAVHCSTDLHDVLDCHDHRVKSCPDDQACGKHGACVAPCTGAEDNASTFGCDFYAVVPGPETETRGSCYAALVANTWTTPITITADYGGQPLDVAGLARTPMGSGGALTYAPLANGQLSPGQIGVLFLAAGPGGAIHHVGCPAGVTPGIAVDPSITGTGLGKAFHITTTAPVAAYDVYPYGGATSYVSSATLLVPTPAWGTNYVAADGFQEDPALASDGGKPFVQVVAATDGTHVTISPTAAIVGGTGVPGTPLGQPISYTLGKGQVLQLLQDEELAGSPIQSDQPISVWGGSGCMNIPVGTYACDSGHQQLVPVKSLGYAYVAARYRDRVTGTPESTPWTLIGAVDGTTLTYDPAPPSGAPTTLANGQLVRFSATDPFSVASQDDKHPFYVAGHMTGRNAIPTNTAGEGDAEYVSVIPPAQWLPYYLFLTDPTYGNANLVFVRQKSTSGVFSDVTLDCAGTVTGWQPVGAAGEYEVARVDLVIDGAPQGSCANGVHTAKSAVPFGLTVWGWDFAVSYAYPAGMSTQPINMVVVPPAPK